MSTKNNPEPGSLKWWLTLIIAVLSAIVGAMGGNAAAMLTMNV